MTSFVVTEIPNIAQWVFADPPAYTRLEPQSETGDPGPGLRMPVHDPLWALLRQWQFGEFLGEDNGRPLGVALSWKTVPLATFETGEGGNMMSRPIADATLLDPEIEGAAAAGTNNLRARAEAGAALVEAIAEAGLDSAGLKTKYGFAAAEIAGAPGLALILRGNPDGARLADGLEQGALPGFAAAAADWLAWYRGGIGQGGGPSGWNRKRLEHDFAIRLKDGRRFEAEAHTGGAIDWWNFDASKKPAKVTATFDLQVGTSELGIGTSSVPAGAKKPAGVESANLVVQPLRYPGMPADRLWEFEDASVNLGGMDIEPNDPARRALVEFATIYGNDWFTAPISVARGGLTSVESVVVTDSFGVPTKIEPADPGPPGAAFRLFQLSKEDSDEIMPGLLTVPAARLILSGEPVESVHLFRDETANMGWAVEERVEGANGRARYRRDEPRAAAAAPSPPPVAPAGVPEPELAYTLETQVPHHWIPLVAMPTDGKGGFVLRKGTMTDTDESRSLLLAGTPVDIMDEELPEAGLRVERVPRLARAADGSLRRWTAFRVQSAAAPGASGLAFDHTEPASLTGGSSDPAAMAPILSHKGGFLGRIVSAIFGKK